jgi:hypothetical protein
MRGRKPSDSATVHRSEKDVANEHLGDFQVENSRGWCFVEAICPGKPLTLKDLKVIGILCEHLTGIHFERNFQRKRALIYKWFDRHFDEIEPLAQIVHLDTQMLDS